MDSYNNVKNEYLKKIRSPEDFKAIADGDAPKVAEEIRHELVRIVSKNGGHLASNLGVVELTMAIHKVFDCPKDHVIFDVGHQSYVHKMLTGRYEKMETIRKAGGISGFTNRNESEYDCFGAGHSSTSLSAALGFAISDKLDGSNAYTVCVIGDGAYTGGMIHEALNNCRKKLNLIIIMNENEMSISKNIGSFASNLSKLRTRPAYFKTKKLTGIFLKKIPLVGKHLFYFILRSKKFIKNALYGSNYFENMGLTYLGPIDGNNYEEVVNLLKEAKKLNESVIVHLKTKKGKGYEPAEKFPEIYHGMSPDTKTLPSEIMNFSHIMGHELKKMADDDQNICAITAAMCDGTGLEEFAEYHKNRFFDVGIAEEHALTFAAGLAANGKKPFVAVYSTFLQRGYDNIIHDIALQKLPVVIGVDRAGLNGGDGSTHHGIFDVAFLSGIPNMTIYSVVTSDSLKEAMSLAFKSGSPVAIRYPNGYDDEEILSEFYSEKSPFGIKCDFSSPDGCDLFIITHGRIVKEALTAKKVLLEQGIKVGIILLEIIKPYDTAAELVMKALGETRKPVIFLEEEIRSGGMGANLSDKLMSLGVLNGTDFEIIATNDSFVSTRQEGKSIYSSAGVDSINIIKAAKKILK